jgi:Na+/H+ antiporter NhaD/arsenite permease-like protein
MKEDPASPMFLAYLVGWVVLAVGSWLHVRSRPTPQEKKRWSDRWCILAGIFVTVFMCLILVVWKQYVGIPIFLAAGIGITLLNLRNTYYCESCGKRSFAQNWFSKTFHCPHCGTQLK